MCNHSLKLLTDDQVAELQAGQVETANCTNCGDQVDSDYLAGWLAGRLDGEITALLDGAP